MINNKLPLVSVAIVSYNGKHNLEYSLPSLTNQTYQNYKIYVLDNNSNDGTEVFLENNFPDVILIKQNENIGMSALNLILNPVFVNDKGDYIFVAGWDTIFHKNCIQDAVEALESDNTIGCLGFRVFGKLNFIPFSEVEIEFQKTSDYLIKEVKWVPGACSLYRRSLLDKVGFIDEEYFAYSEEDDVQFRIWSAGFRLVEISTPCWFNVDVSSIPKEHASYLYFRNFIRYNLKNSGLLLALRETLSVFKVACMPFYTIDLSTRVNQRKRPYGIFKNLIILLKAFGWNVLNFHRTIKASVISSKQIQDGQKFYKELTQIKQK